MKIEFVIGFNYFYNPFAQPACSVVCVFVCALFPPIRSYQFTESDNFVFLIKVSSSF